MLSIFKKGDQRKNNTALKGGRRDGENTNPYLTARRTWNDHVGGVMSKNRLLLVLGLLSLLVALAGVGGMIKIGGQSKFIPYVVEVDKHGTTVASGPVYAASKVNPNQLSATVAEFITDARMVTPDISLQRKAVFRVYSHLAKADPALAKMNEWLNGDPEKTPFARAANEMVEISIETVLRQTETAWQVEWLETVRDRQGVVQKAPIPMRALITTYIGELPPNATEEDRRRNPMSIFVGDYSWTQIK